MKKTEKAKGVCLIPECDGEAAPGRRGLCQTCYGAMRREMRAGNTTEKKMIRKGYLLPARPGRRSERADKARAAISQK